ncbi:hypothetical protein ACP70R_032355 [Stipagrostis hirtigluma subsp. patula]
MPASVPLAVVLAAAALLLLARAAAAGEYGGRMVIVHASGITGGTGARDLVTAASTTTWRHRRLEDEVAPEFPVGGGGMLRAGGGEISYGALDRDKAQCQRDNQCAAKGGGSYTRPCTFKNQCA